MTRLKERLHRNELTLGSWITLGHPAIGEIMAASGFDWLTIDMEHSAITLHEAQQLIQVIELAGCTPLVRVGCNDPNMIKRVMDAGSHGVIVPQVNSPEEAQVAVQAVKYPPQGIRGVGLARAQGYGMEFERYKAWNDQESIVIVQIEHIRAVDELESILSVHGVDGFIVGPYDLSASLGVPGQFDHPAFLQAMERVLDSVRQASCISPGFHVVPPDLDLLNEKINDGYRFVAYSLDSLFLAEKCTRDLNTLLRENFRPRTYIKEMTE